jgi:hypothetical protein
VGFFHVYRTLHIPNIYQINTRQLIKDKIKIILYADIIFLKEVNSMDGYVTITEDEYIRLQEIEKEMEDINVACEKGIDLLNQVELELLEIKESSK